MIQGSRAADIAILSADLLRIIVNANLGIPGKPGGEVARQIVREVRALYEEVDKPTPTPKRRTQQAARMVDQDDDEGGTDPTGMLDEFDEGEIG